MKIRDDANTTNSLYHLAIRWARANDSNFTFSDFVQSANVALDKIAALIKRYDDSWKWKDANDANELIDTSLELQSGVSGYAVPSNVFKIARVRILESDGTTWRTIEKKTRRQISDDEMKTSYIRYWYILGTKIYLAGEPDYSQTNGIEINFKVQQYILILMTWLILEEECLS